MAGEQIRLLVVEDVPQVASHMRSLLQAQSQIKMLDVVTAGDRAVGQRRRRCGPTSSSSMPCSRDA